MKTIENIDGGIAIIHKGQAGNMSWENKVKVVEGSNGFMYLTLINDEVLEDGTPQFEVLTSGIDVDEALAIISRLEAYVHKQQRKTA
mgnify:CR=1 FL=1